MLRPPDTTWKLEAACQDSPPELFFPTRAKASLHEAKAKCAGCPVRMECLQSAFDNGDMHGVWGGLSWDQIDHYRKKGKTDARQVLAIEFANARQAKRLRRSA